MNRSEPMARDAMGASALMRAAQAGRAPCVRLLRAFGARDRDAMGRTPLMMSAQAGSAACVEALLPLSDQQAACSQGFQAAHWAAKHGHARLAMELARLAGPQAELDDRGQDLAMLALEGGHFSAAAALARADSMRRKDAQGRQLLDLALSHAAGHRAKQALEDQGLRFLLRRLASASDWMGEDGRALAVERAAGAGLCRELAAGAAAGSLWERRAQGPTFLAAALRACSPQNADRLFDEAAKAGALRAPQADVDVGQEMALAVGTQWLAWLGALPNPRKAKLFGDPKRQPTAALEALARGQASALPWVADPRLDLDARGADGSSALMLAARWGLVEFARALAPLGDGAAKNRQGLCAAWIAAAHGHEECVQILAARAPKRLLECPTQAAKAWDVAIEASKGSPRCGLPGMVAMLAWMDIAGSKMLQRACAAGLEDFAIAVERAGRERGLAVDWDDALGRACEGLQPKTARWALRLGDPSARDPQGRDALSRAARAARASGADAEAFAEVAMMLALDARWDPGSRDWRGRSAKDWSGRSREDLADCQELGEVNEASLAALEKALAARSERDELGRCARGAPQGPRPRL